MSYTYDRVSRARVYRMATPEGALSAGDRHALEVALKHLVTRRMDKMQQSGKYEPIAPLIYVCQELGR